LVFALISAPAMTLCRRGAFWSMPAVDDVQVRRAHAGNDQVAPLLGRIVMARRAGVPAHVMQLVSDARHFQPADDLAVGGAVRVRVDGRQVVRLLMPVPM
jgi:hypothetical protein